MLCRLNAVAVQDRAVAVQDRTVAIQDRAVAVQDRTVAEVAVVVVAAVNLPLAPQNIERFVFQVVL